MTKVTKRFLTGVDLYSALKPYSVLADDSDNQTLSSEDWLEVYLSNGNHTLSNRLEFNCNVIIRGSGATVIATNYLNLGDDCLFAVKGDSTAKLKLEVYNTTFKASFFTKVARHYFKIVYADSVIFKNCNINLMNNGVITNIDLRKCSNIEITGCTLQNYNECNAGGILWIRGETNNILISGNTFRKHGNDEALAIWGNGNLGETDITSVVKKNIQVVNNTFEYGRTDYSKYGIDKYIAFYDSDTTDTVSYEWDNVLIAENKFVLTDLVRNLIHLNFGTKNIIVRNITIENNTISHSGYAVEKNTEDSTLNDFERDFIVLSQSNNDVFVVIKDNVVTANHTVYADSNFYVNLMVDGAKVDYIGNSINATRMLNQYDSSGIKLNTVGIIVFELVGVGGNLMMQDNNIRGIYRLGRCYFPNLEGTDVFLNLVNNHFEGDNRIWCRGTDLQTMNVGVYGNDFVTDSSLLLFQNFGAAGSFYVCNNTWEKSDSYSGNAKIYKLDTGLVSPTFQKIIFAGNQFLNFAETEVSFSGLPSAKILITEKNIFNQQ